MEHQNQKVFFNKGIKRLYIGAPIVIIAFSILYSLIPGTGWSSIISAIIVVLGISLFQIRKYVITTDGVLEFYHFLGRAKSKSIPIENITEILLKPNRISVEYRRKGYSYPLSFILELNDMDMKEMRAELLKRNPNIEIN